MSASKNNGRNGRIRRREYKIRQRVRVIIVRVRVFRIVAFYIGPRLYLFRDKRSSARNSPPIVGGTYPSPSNPRHVPRSDIVFSGLLLRLVRFFFRVNSTNNKHVRRRPSSSAFGRIDDRQCRFRRRPSRGRGDWGVVYIAKDSAARWSWSKKKKRVRLARKHSRCFNRVSRRPNNQTVRSFLHRVIRYPKTKILAYIWRTRYTHALTIQTRHMKCADSPRDSIKRAGVSIEKSIARFSADRAAPCGAPVNIYVGRARGHIPAVVFFTPKRGVRRAS